MTQRLIFIWFLAQPALKNSASQNSLSSWSFVWLIINVFICLLVGLRLNLRLRCVTCLTNHDCLWPMSRQFWSWLYMWGNAILGYHHALPLLQDWDWLQQAELWAFLGAEPEIGDLHGALIAPSSKHGEQLRLDGRFASNAWASLPQRTPLQDQPCKLRSSPLLHSGGLSWREAGRGLWSTTKIAHRIALHFVCMPPW